MKTIVKTHAIPANQLIDSYLFIARSEPWFRFRQLYRHFGPPQKSLLIDNILLPEQDHLCCYCMRKLNNHTYGTIEHIIPQSTPNAAGMVPYFRFGYPGLSPRNICHSTDFVNGNFIHGQYPHEVAYYNFVIACPRCNKSREDNFVDPLYFDSNKTRAVVYDRQTGEMTWLTDPVITNPNSLELPNLEKIKLNTPLLKAIRAVWLYGKDYPTDTYSTPDTIQNLQDRSDLVYRTLGAILDSDQVLDDEDLNAYIELLKDGIWQRVLEYDYFGTI